MNEPYDVPPPIGTLAPDFIAFTRQGTISLEDWRADSWLVLVSTPGSESRSFGPFAERAPAFAARGVKLLGLTLARGVGSPGGPPEAPLARIDKRTARAFGLVEEGAEELRPAMIVLDPTRVVRAALYYPPGVARSVAGALRLVDALRAGDAWISARFRRDAREDPADLEWEVDRNGAAGEDPRTDEPPFGFSRPVLA